MLGVQTIVPDLWAAGVADALSGFLAGRPSSRICLPTGDTPRPAYRLFAERGGRLGRATVFLLDEFGLPPGSPSRCDEMIRRDLLDLLEEPPGVLHAINVQADDLDAECDRYEDLVRSGGLDLAILGLGANGHLGLNEPGSSRDSVTRVVELTRETRAHSETYGADEAATWGATMGIDTLLSAARIWLLVTGSHKAAILEQALSQPVGPQLPATFLQTHHDVTVFADDNAAALL